MQAKDEVGRTDAQTEPWPELLSRLRVRLAAIMAAHEIPPHDAEDLVQDTLLAFVSQRAEIRSPESYLLGILRHRCAAYIRQRYKERHVLQVDPATLEALAGAAPVGHESLDHRLDLATLLDSLPAGQSCVLLLRFLGFSHDEIGAACRRAGPTVRRDSTRAIAKLQAIC
jgi:RNA polymerase sigma factor (sigma-70 family)